MTLIESTCKPPVSAAKRVKDCSVSRRPRGRSRCCRSRNRAATARRGKDGGWGGAFMGGGARPPLLMNAPAARVCHKSVVVAARRLETRPERLVVEGILLRIERRDRRNAEPALQKGQHRRAIPGREARNIRAVVS